MVIDCFCFVTLASLMSANACTLVEGVIPREGCFELMAGVASLQESAMQSTQAPMQSASVLELACDDSWDL